MKVISDKKRKRRDLLKTIGQVNNDTLRDKGKLLNTLSQESNINDIILLLFFGESTKKLYIGTNKWKNIL